MMGMPLAMGLVVARAVERPPPLRHIADQGKVAPFAIGTKIQSIVPHTTPVYPMAANFADYRTQHCPDSKRK
jgi:hypothetical protein